MERELKDESVLSSNEIHEMEERRITRLNEAGIEEDVRVVGIDLEHAAGDVCAVLFRLFAQTPGFLAWNPARKAGVGRVGTPARRTESVQEALRKSNEFRGLALGRLRGPVDRSIDQLA